MYNHRVSLSPLTPAPPSWLAVPKLWGNDPVNAFTTQSLKDSQLKVDEKIMFGKNWPALYIKTLKNIICWQKLNILKSKSLPFLGEIESLHKIWKEFLF